MSHPYFATVLRADGPPSPSPTRPRKRKREDEEEEYDTPTKTRSTSVSSHALGLPTPNERVSLSTENEMKLDGSPSRTLARAPLLGAAGMEDKKPINQFSRNRHDSAMQQITPPPSVSPIATDIPSGNVKGEGSPTRTRSSTAPGRLAIPVPQLLFHLPRLLLQPPTSSMHATSLAVSILSIQRVLMIHAEEESQQVLTPEQECFAWMMLAELGIQALISFTKEPSTLEGHGPSKDVPSEPEIPPWALNPREIEMALSKSLRLTDQVASLGSLRHRLTFLHSQLVFMQKNTKHARVLLKQLLPLSTTSHTPSKEQAWKMYEAHLTITHQILNTASANRSKPIDHQAAISQLTALCMSANQYGDYAVVQLATVIRFTLLFHHFESNDRILSSEVDRAMLDAEHILGLDGFDKSTQGGNAEKPPVSTATPQAPATTTPGAGTPHNQDGITTPFSRDALAGGGTGVNPYLKTPAFTLPVNPLAVDVYSAEQKPAQDQSGIANPQLIPPFLRYLRVHTLMLSVLWLTQCGDSVRSAERLLLVHEMMDRMNDLSNAKGIDDSWSSGNESGLITVPLYSNPGHPLRIKVTHPRVLYQLTFVLSSAAKRDAIGRKPKRKVFAEEGLKVGQLDDVRLHQDPNISKTEGGPPLSFALGLGARDLRQAQGSIAHIRALTYCETISVCLVRSEFDEAERHLADLISFLRSVDAATSSQPGSVKMWDRYASRVTLLHGHLAHALGRSQRALDCYNAVVNSEEEGSLMWGMGRVGEIVLKIGLSIQRRATAVATTTTTTGEATEPKNLANGWKDGERERLTQMSASVVEKCLSGEWGENMVIVGRLIAASLSGEIVRTKQNLKSGLDLSCKSRDNSLRLMVLIITAGQYLHTYSEYALTILDTCRQLASGMGTVPTAAPTAENTQDANSEEARRSNRLATTKEPTEYHVGHARAGLWIGDRLSELYKRGGQSQKMSKQNALNAVFDKAVQALDSKATSFFGDQDSYEFQEQVSIEEPKPLTTVPTAARATASTTASTTTSATVPTIVPATPAPEPPPTIPQIPPSAYPLSPTKKFEGVIVPRLDVVLEPLPDVPLHQRTQSQGSFRSSKERSQASSNSQGPPSTHGQSQDTPMSTDEVDSKSVGVNASRSRHSKGRGSVYSVSSSMSVTSTGTRHSTRSRTNKVIIESDDEHSRHASDQDEYELSD